MLGSGLRPRVSTEPGHSAPGPLVRAPRIIANRRAAALAGVVARFTAAAVVVAAALATLVVTGCGTRAHEAGPAAAGDTVTVSVIRPATEDAEGALALPGRIRAREEVRLTSRIAAPLTRLPVREGGHFARGQTLARFEAPETREAVLSARARLEAATVARDHARVQEARVDSLFADRVAARRDLDLAQSARRAAEAAWADARAALERWLMDTAIEAPFDGVVARRHVDAGQSVAAGQPLLDIRSLEVDEIEVAVPESELGRLAGARATFQAGDGPWGAARLLRIDGATDPATRTRLATFRAEAPGAGLAAGAFARVRLAATPSSENARRPGTERDTTSMLFNIPSRSLVRRGALTGVYVVRDGRARLRWLRVGLEAGGRIEVLAGLSAGEDIILSPEGLADGRPVRLAQ